MKKFFYLPKIVTLVFISLFFLIFLTADITACYLSNNVLSIGASKAAEYISVMHIFRGLSVIAMAVYVVWYLSRCVDHCYRYWGRQSIENKSNSFKNVGWIVVVAEAFLAGTFFVLFPYIQSESCNMLRQELAINLKKNSDLFYCLQIDRCMEIVDVWAALIVLAIFGLHIYFFVNMIKKWTFSKRINRVRKDEINIEKMLGFYYESSTFFRQTKLKYHDLKHENGTFGEFEAYRNLRIYEDYGAAFVFNREIPKEDGLFTEIDLLMIHPYGIIAFENKDYSGTIYGSAGDQTWTEINRRGQKISFYNPVKQNEGHIKALKAFLEKCNLYNEDSVPIYSVIVFTDTQSSNSDDIISRINMVGSNAKLCTSQNLYYVVTNLLQSSKDTAKVSVNDVQNLLLRLSVRKK